MTVLPTASREAACKHGRHEARRQVSRHLIGSVVRSFPCTGECACSFLLSVHPFAPMCDARGSACAPRRLIRRPARERCPPRTREGSKAGAREARVRGLGKCGFSYLRGTVRSWSLIPRFALPHRGGNKGFTRAVRGRGEHGCTRMCKAIWHGPAAQRMVQAGLLS